jgi:hypothetical protein
MAAQNYAVTAILTLRITQFLPARHAIQRAVWIQNIQAEAAMFTTAPIAISAIGEIDASENELNFAWHP